MIFVSAIVPDKLNNLGIMETIKDLTTALDRTPIGGLKLVQTTSEMNGYPANLKNAIIGFDNFQEAQEMADEYGFEIQILQKRDGQQLWSRTGNTAFKALENTAENFGDNYSEIDSMISSEDFFEDEVNAVLRDNTFESFEDLQNFVGYKKEIWEEIENAEPHEIVITQDGVYSETLPKTAMYRSHDTITQIIAIIDLNE